MSDISLNFYKNKNIDNCTKMRFLSHVKVDEKTGAWIWTGGKTGNGYGAFWYKGKTVSAHRFSYILAYGEIDDNIFVCHKYEDYGRENVNPLHLFLGDAKDNMRDASVKLRLPFGAKNINAKLTADEAREIANSNETNEFLATKHKISSAKVSQIRRGQSWVNATGIKIENKKLALNNKTGFIGVRLDSNKRRKTVGYRASITAIVGNKKKTLHLGSFDNPIDAAKAFDAAAIKYRGVSAKLNFPL